MMLSHAYYKVVGIDKLDSCPILIDRIKQDPNCARMTMGKSWDKIILPDTQFTRLLVNNEQVGVIMIDAPVLKHYQCHHICMFEEHKDRTNAAVLTQLAVQLSLMKGIQPFTTVLNTSEFTYMHKFLEECGFVNGLSSKSNVRWYETPKDWHVPTISSYSVFK